MNSQNMKPLKDKSLVANIIKEMNRKYQKDKYQKETSMIKTMNRTELPININSYFNKNNQNKTQKSMEQQQFPEESSPSRQKRILLSKGVNNQPSPVLKGPKEFGCNQFKMQKLFKNT